MPREEDRQAAADRWDRTEAIKRRMSQKFYVVFVVADEVIVHPRGATYRSPLVAGLPYPQAMRLAREGVVLPYDSTWVFDVYFKRGNQPFEAAYKHLGLCGALDCSEWMKSQGYEVEIRPAANPFKISVREAMVLRTLCDLQEDSPRVIWIQAGEIVKRLGSTTVPRLLTKLESRSLVQKSRTGRGWCPTPLGMGTVGIITLFSL